MIKILQRLEMKFVLVYVCIYIYSKDISFIKNIISSSLTQPYFTSLISNEDQENLRKEMVWCP